ncbi:MAG: hypothetical protein KDA27_28075, partial [Candidatus Eisenbacteria bacterium]|nr:hypothetical protein [Candidatus Eisenbacteria bacterium]
ARAVREMLSDSLGRADESVEALARSAYYAEGDLLRCAEVFGGVFEQAEECEDGWRLLGPSLGSSPDGEVSDCTAPDTYESVWTLSDSRGDSIEESILSKLSADLRAAIELLAQLDERFPQSVAMGVLEEFGPRGSTATSLISRLTELGVLVQVGQDSETWIEIESPTVRRHASVASIAPEGRERLDRWLLDNAPADPASVQSVLATCRRARRLGDREFERAVFATGLQAAIEQGRHADLADILAHPEDPPHEWTVSTLRSRISRGIELSGCDPARLKINTVAAFLTYSRTVGERYLDELLGDPHPIVRGNALARAADRDIGYHGAERAAGYLNAIVKEGLESVLPVAQLDLERARLARVSGRTDEAMAHVRRACELSKGLGTYLSALSLQQLGILCSDKSKRRAFACFRDAAAEAPSESVRAQMYFNSALLLAHTTRQVSAMQFVERALSVFAEMGNRTMVLRSRMLRASIMTSIHGPRSVLSEVRSLQDFHEIRSDSARLASLLTLQTNAYLTLGNSPAAVRSAGVLWRLLQRPIPERPRSAAVDAIVQTLRDTESWGFVEEYFGRLLEEGIDRLDSGSEIRVRALVAEAQQDLDRAISTLQAAIEERGDSIAAVDAGLRRDVVSLLLRRAGESDLESALEVLDAIDPRRVASTFPYSRIRLRIDRAEALWRLARRREATRVLDEAIAEARRHEAKGLLATSLARRASWTT